MNSFWEPLWLSLQLAAVTTPLLLLLGTLVVYGLTFRRYTGRALLKAVVSLPLVLPPTVLGYYLLLAFRPAGPLGALAEGLFGARLAFSFAGLVVASLVFSLPFMVNPILSAVEGLPASYREAAYTLGKSRWATYWRVLLPNARSAVVVGAVMSFAHTIGEFGVILMIGGNIPGQTRVASLAIYHEVELLNYEAAHRYALVLLLFSLVILAALYRYQSARLP